MSKRLHKHNKDKTAHVLVDEWGTFAPSWCFNRTFLHKIPFELINRFTDSASIFLNSWKCALVEDSLISKTRLARKSVSKVGLIVSSHAENGFSKHVFYGVNECVGFI